MKARSCTLSCAYFSGAWLEASARANGGGSANRGRNRPNCSKLKPAYPLPHRGRMNLLEVTYLLYQPVTVVL